MGCNKVCVGMMALGVSFSDRVTGALWTLPIPSGTSIGLSVCLVWFSPFVLNY